MPNQERWLKEEKDVEMTAVRIATMVESAHKAMVSSRLGAVGRQVRTYLVLSRLQ